ncbi:hypothetical protein DPMN_190719 [Dreissena polymorpha]|uniref:Uncharacterized protein n=1 Tax=Dreissena polymorpha TaxID=45954 RepID=A0A9D3XZX1_DREPO|nr:hypothetical protein DPMN_190719 [Dreissena polymorpha]
MDFERNERQLCKKTRQWGSRPIGMDAMPAGIAMLFFDADSGPDMTDLTGLDVTDST